MRLSNDDVVPVAATAVVAPVEFTVEHAAADEALDGLPQRIRALFYDPGYRPPSPPSVALELVAVARSGDLEVDEAVSILQRDQLLLARVLRVARAPLYGAARIPTVRDAVVRLGERKLVHVVLEAALEMKLFHSDAFGPWMEKVRRHSVAVGHIAGHIAGHVGVDPDQALVAGLLHDIGTAAALGALGDDPVLKAVASSLDAATLGRALGRVHADVGAVVADAWEQNLEVEAIVSGHHHVQKSHDRLLAVVVVAEAFAIAAGFDVSADVVDEADLAWAHADLRITDAQLTRMAAELGPLLAML